MVESGLAGYMSKKIVDLSYYKEITRQQVLLSIDDEPGKEIICRVRKGEYETISSLDDLQKVVLLEQRKLTDPLIFYCKNV